MTSYLRARNGPYTNLAKAASLGLLSGQKFIMPKVKRSRKPPPDGWELIEPTLDELDQKMREGKSEVGAHHDVALQHQLIVVAKLTRTISETLLGLTS